MMSTTCNSLLGGAKLMVAHRDGQLSSSTRRTKASNSTMNTSLNYCTNACKTWRIRKPVTNSILHANLKANPFIDHKQFSSSLVAQCFDQVASLNADEHEQQQSSSSDSSEQNNMSSKTLKLQSASCYIPHPNKAETGGEDAHFICDGHAVGVADGVGAWRMQGVDAGEYARELMLHSLKATEEEPKGSVNSLRVLEKAYARTNVKGSSTACIIALTYDQGIHAVNLGDSGFIVFRDGRTIFSSSTQQHDFNIPYQLECDNASDLPSDGQVYTVPVESGDVIVAGTDGLFDNLYTSEIATKVVDAMEAGLGPQAMAQKIAALALQHAKDKNVQTPFSTAARKAGYYRNGGKLDDTTVVISFITAFDT